ncbi:hypothetical protein [uncultured Alistipes sp.]|uniref:hypothetical protein n=1 Tax=uncultured Alistipes sp. TaxID=538949 RepID=UPI002632EE76|nr:hypothetical protein [uncultured Alistipes sp.]
MVDKIVADYMRSNKRLVVPQFGAFIRKDTDGKIVFVPFLKKDDGVLVERVANVCGLAPEEARKAVDDYVAGMKAGIAVRGSFLVEGVGRLVADSEGAYRLEDDTQTAPRPTSAPADAPGPAAGSTLSPSAGTGTGQTSVRRQEPAEAAFAKVLSGAEVRRKPEPAAMPPAQRPRTTAPQPPVPQNGPQAAAPVRPGRPAATTAPDRMPGKQEPPVRQNGYPRTNAPAAGQNRPPFPPRSSAPRGARPSQRPPMQGRPQPGPGGFVKKTKTDGFILIALLVAIAALAVIVYGMFVKHGEPDIKSMLFPEQETVSTVETDIE